MVENIHKNIYMMNNLYPNNYYNSRVKKQTTQFKNGQKT